MRFNGSFERRTSIGKKYIRQSNSKSNVRWLSYSIVSPRNLITAEDFHVEQEKEKESLVPNIRTIDEAEEPEEDASNLVVIDRIAA